MAMVNLTTPWIEFYNSVNAFFKRDKEVHVIFDNEAKVLKLYVDNASKAAALTALLPEKKEFGLVEVMIQVIQPNGESESADHDDLETLLNKAFAGNAAVSFVKVVHGFAEFTATYVVFKKAVVQYYTDDLGDYYGINSTLYENIARDIFGGINGLFFSTNVDSNDPIGAPLGEWP